MIAGKLRAIVATSTLDMGIDWGDVDLVIQLGAPKGSSRLLQRIGRANHRLDEPSRALLVPYNRFEALECDAAKEAVEEGALDGEDPAQGALDVLAQHVVGRAIGEPFTADELFDEVRTASPYAGLERATFDRVLEFASTGGYALRSYDRFRRLVLGKDGRWRIRTPDFAARWRMNVGTIVEAPMLSVRLAGKGGRPGRKLGEIEEYFIEHLAPGDTFVFAGEVLEFVGLQETDALVMRSAAENPKVPSYEGGKFPLSTYLAARVRARISSGDWDRLPGQVREWLEIQRLRSIIPGADEMLIETFPRANRFYMAAYPFEGRLAHQTLGMLLTRRLDRAGLHPLGFVATEYALAVHGLSDMAGLDWAALFDEDMLGDDLDAWLQETPLMKRTFRKNAVIAGLIERRFPGLEKTGRQVTFSSDLIYDVLRRHEPDHILLQAAYQDAAGGLLDLRRLSDLLARIKGHIVHAKLDRLSPLAVPLMVEIGRESVHGEAADAILASVSEDLIAEATRL
jgi:ATP-dependent Lhr-like helicase